jgi:[ribosomal protein S5]-alanine N-acetyltransferase
MVTELDGLPEVFRAPLATVRARRLVLRPFVPADADAVEPLLGDAEISAGTLSIPHPYPEGGAATWIAEHPERWRAGRLATWAVTLGAAEAAERADGAAAGAIVGAMSLKLTLAHRRAELGYWIARPEWGRGYATEAVGAAIGFAFEVLDLHRVDAHHLVENPASGVVMRKAGMQFEGRRRGAVVRAGVPRDVEEYAILRTDPRG